MLYLYTMYFKQDLIKLLILKWKNLWITRDFVIDRLNIPVHMYTYVKHCFMFSVISARVPDFPDFQRCKM